MQRKFFSLAEMKQPVNQWLCVAFLGVWFFWMVLFYASVKANDVGNSWTNNNSNISALDF